ncbi:lycopene cyclase domain-containing protein [Corynebacterium uterequi]|uniref:Lycopene cyclase domain n=1 Tax=Corynebacterium uterequi TaxID=1072256 RepID=A0A0G3HDK8_9CORY|nr:lycopene cyclase domain-containing protein [Corynebacterium uterequi]AKK10053.1 lycopene cyclase domain [Corynebacterium uterequi]
MTYVLMSLPFLALAAGLWWRRRRSYARQSAVTAVVLLVVTVLTIVFDNLMIYAGNVAYGSAHNLGLYLGLMPVEDLFYPLVATLIITAFWKGDRHDSA